MPDLDKYRKGWIKSYLGPFFKRPSRGVSESLKGIDVYGRYLIKSGDIEGVVAYCLMKQGRLNYRVLTSTQVIDIFLGKNDEFVAYTDLVDKVLFCLVSGAEMENKRRWELVYQLSYERAMNNMGLIIVYDTSCPVAKDLEKIGFLSIGSGSVNGKESKGDNF